MLVLLLALVGCSRDADYWLDYDAAWTVDAEDAEAACEGGERAAVAPAHWSATARHPIVVALSTFVEGQFASEPPAVCNDVYADDCVWELWRKDVLNPPNLEMEVDCDTLEPADEDNYLGFYLRRDPAGGDALDTLNIPPAVE